LQEQKRDRFGGPFFFTLRLSKQQPAHPARKPAGEPSMREGASTGPAAQKEAKTVKISASKRFLMTKNRI
jgi:hypothetical protein